VAISPKLRTLLDMKSRHNMGEMSYSFILNNDSNGNNHSGSIKLARQSVDANLQVIDNTETFSVHCFPRTKGNINIDTINCFAHDNKLCDNRDQIVSCNSLIHLFVLNLL
jgi:hypothetical protein